METHAAPKPEMRCRASLSAIAAASARSCLRGLVLAEAGSAKLDPADGLAIRASPDRQVELPPLAPGLEVSLRPRAAVVALTQAMSFLASRGSELPQWVWVLDSDVVISRSDALEKAVNRAEETDAAIVGESWWAPCDVESAAAMHDELMRAFRADVGPLDDQKAVEALTMRA